MMEYYGMHAAPYSTIVTPWGRLLLVIGARGLRSVSFDESTAFLRQAPDFAPAPAPWAEAFAAYLAGQPFPPELPLDLSPVPAFTRQVLEACRLIPFGETRSYAALATALGRPRAARAVGQALARNPLPVVIPCHRVVGTNGRLTGFRGGLAWKRALLAHEGILHTR